MLTIKKDSGKYEVTVGIACENKYAKDKALTKPLTLKFSENAVGNLQKLKAKIKYLQAGIDAMPQDKREALQKDSLVTEAFESSKFENVFKDITEPDEQRQKAIVQSEQSALTVPAELFMRNTASARTEALKKARANSEAGAATFTQEDIKTIQANIYDKANELNGVEGSELMSGHILTGKYKKNMNGDFGRGGTVAFKTVHPDVTEPFMADLVKFIDSPEAQAMDPVLRAIVAHHMFVQIHPFEDGNGRTSRILYEALLATANKGELDLRDVVNISESYSKTLLQLIYPHIHPNMNGEVELDSFIETTSKMLETAVDVAIKRAGLPEPELPVSVNPRSGGLSAG